MTSEELRPDAAESRGRGCGDHFGSSISVTDTWTYRTFYFSEVFQEGWGQKFPELATQSLYHMYIIVPPDTKFDLWFDDFQFER